MKSYQLIGLMSGTSLDGLDVAHVKFQVDEKGKWIQDLLSYYTISYSSQLKEKIKNAHLLGSFQLYLLDKELGEFYAKQVNSFIKKNKISKKSIDAIASHGQTIFHQPEKGITVQIGCGQTLASKTGIKTINDFRKKDVIFGGQGAPLVPIGDFSLFADEAESFLNIGGFTNISFKKEDKIIAFDICPGNLPLNKLANSKELEYDKNGELAKTGEINFFLLNLLNELDFYSSEGPKSLGTEWLEQYFYPLIKFDKDIENNLRTVIEHISYQIAAVLNQHELKSVFISGGGALNLFLVDRIKHYFSGEVIIPNREIIEYKEAIIFAFLGALFLEKKPNCLSSVTGAKKDVIGGVLHLA
ncbi:MAG: anhydro-N-acetylmuramic acid kinase [Bacteroidota bacterium]